MKAGLLVGTLDILSAFTYYYIKTHQTHFLDVFKFIASGVVGKETAYSGGTEMILLGVVLHYTIALAFAAFFFYLYPRVNVLHKNVVLVGIGYGLFVWCVMNLMIVPFSNVAHRPFNVVNALINIIILMICIGIPLSYLARRS